MKYLIVAIALITASGAHAAAGDILTDPELLAEFTWVRSLSQEDYEAVQACYPDEKKNTLECMHWDEMREIGKQQPWVKREVAQYLKKHYTSKILQKQVAANTHGDFAKAVGDVVGELGDVTGAVVSELADEPLAWAVLGFFLLSNPFGWLLLIGLIWGFFATLSALFGGSSEGAK